jgi:hypothetical protein
MAGGVGWRAADWVSAGWAAARAAWLRALAWLLVAWDPFGGARAPLTFWLGTGARRTAVAAALVRGSDVRGLRAAAFFWRRYPDQSFSDLAALAGRWGLGNGFEVEGVLYLPAGGGGGLCPFALVVDPAAGTLALRHGECAHAPAPPPLGGAALSDVFRVFGGARPCPAAPRFAPPPPKRPAHKYA